MFEKKKKIRGKATFAFVVWKQIKAAEGHFHALISINWKLWKRSNETWGIILLTVFVKIQNEGKSFAFVSNLRSFKSKSFQIVHKKKI